MEIIITEFFKELHEPGKFSGSVLELGAQAGEITWGNALAQVEKQNPLLNTFDKREAFIAHMISSGFRDDIEEFPDDELEALFIQLISGDVRESEGLTAKDWGLYAQECESGQVSSRIFKGTDGEIYYYLGE